jgi:glycogen synthase
VSGALPRRVLMTADAVGGVWPYALELSAGLSRAGVRVLLAVLGPAPDEAQRTAAEQVAGLELIWLGGRLEWMEEPWADVDAAGAELQRAAERHGSDLVHLNGFAHGALAFPGPRLVVAHSCVLSWWRAVKGVEAPASWDRYRERVRAGLLGADRVVAPSHAMGKALLECHGPLPAVEVIENGRSGFSGPAVAKQPFILSAGRLWDEAKNVARLAEVAPSLSWPVRVAGDPGPVAWPAVTRLGRLDGPALQAQYAAAALYALPARYEPFGLSALEAALAGCALVLGDIASLRELWRDAAAFVPPDDPGALRAAIQRLIDEPWRRALLAARARRRARRYSAARMAHRYLDLYGRLLDGARKEIPACAS